MRKRERVLANGLNFSLSWQGNLNDRFIRLKKTEGSENTWSKNDPGRRNCKAEAGVHLAYSGKSKEATGTRTQWMRRTRVKGILINRITAGPDQAGPGRSL